MSKSYLHALALLLVVAALCCVFIAPPNTGDDLSYWSTAFAVHERGTAALTANFHDLRWPVWGVCWMLQGIFGHGMITYTGEAILYMCAGSLIAFQLGRLLLRSLPAAWGCGLVFVFHPILDDMCNAPWPDLPEGIWTGAAMLAWWQMMHAEARDRLALWAVLCGLCVYIAEANRVTGLFIAPVMLLCTLLYFRRRFGWLLVAGGVAALAYGGEAVFYHARFGDWLHSLHSTIAAKGVRGTEPVPLLTMPFRFLDSLWNKGLSPAYCVFGLLGLWAGWTGRLRSADEEGAGGDRVAGKVLALWLGVLYLEYACAPQSLSPWRPIVRDGLRFLGSLVPLISVFAVAGIVWVFRQPRLLRWRWFRWWPEHPLATGALITALLIAGALQARDFATTGFVPKLRSYVQTIPPGTHVLASSRVRSLAMLAAGEPARKLVWTVSDRLPEWNAYDEVNLGHSQELWYLRRSLYVTSKTKLMRNGAVQAGKTYLSSFGEDAPSWQVTQILAPNKLTTIICKRRRAPGTPRTPLLTAQEAGLQELLPELPKRWEIDKKAKAKVKLTWSIPPVLRGKWCTLTAETASNHVVPFLAELTFWKGQTPISESLFHPYCFQNDTRDFFSFGIPAEADRCTVEVAINRKTHWFNLSSLQIAVDEMVMPMAAMD